MKLPTAYLKLGLISLAFFSFSLVAQPTHKITSSLGFKFNLPESWKLFTSQELIAANAATTNENKLHLSQEQLVELTSSFEEGIAELLVNTASVTEAASLVDNLVLSPSNYQVPSHPRKVKSACAALPSLLSTSLNTQVKLTRCEGVIIKQKPSLVIGYTTELNPDIKVLQYLIQLTANKSINATLTYQAETSSSAAAFEAAMLKLEVIP